MTQLERVFVRFRGRTIGPFSPEKIQEMVRRGQVTRMHELSGDGLSWMKADQFGSFFPRVSSVQSGDLAAEASNVPPGGQGGGAAATANENASAQWYAHVNGEKQGPVSMDQMRLYAEAKILKKDSLVWKNGMDAWKPAVEVLGELFGKTGKEGMVSSSAGDEAEAGGMTPITGELSSQYAGTLMLGIALLATGGVLVIAQLFALSQGTGPTNADYLATAVRVALGLVLGMAGVLALQVAAKIQSLREYASPAAALMTVKTASQFWLYAGVGLMVYLVILVVVLVIALATNVALLDVLV
ncbi:DUF4339 domain-containing protein [Roseiconus nitratireducens]|uniref:DUF4339 domain-containing protein n=1 Tax=Roseiconus nitratireducens TaxID=2605748 RepID=A0A5M6CXP9_9BACT|nr:DUF4339 domain-containing protein [Roseiconus nitratireducens]KAA5539883.1 DUF4339 domain-containing protein [Roseiconus nitratireducens]